MKKNELFEIIKFLAEDFDLDSLTEDEKDILLETNLFEQAKSRNEFISFVENIGWQIVENVCLILFMNQYRSNILTISHWKTELYAHCSNILKKKVKSGDKRKLLEHTFFSVMDFSDNEHIFNALWEKFDTEGVNIFDESYAVYEVVEEFQSILKEDLIPLMCNPKGFEELREYIIDM